MSVLLSWFSLLLFLYGAVFYAHQAWRMRPFGGRQRPGTMIYSAGMSVGAAALVWSMAAKITRASLPHAWLWVMLPALVLIPVAYLWAHIEEIRDEWAGRKKPPDPAQYPTSEWRKAAAWSTIVAVPFLYVLYRWRLPYPGIVGICAAMLAVTAWSRWLWARWDLFLIRRIQARNSPSRPPEWPIR